MTSDLALHGQVAWVVGASGAIGQAVAGALADAGAQVFASSRQARTLEPLARPAQGTREGCIEVLPVDVTSTKSVAAAVRQIMDSAGRIDILVNTTTVPRFGAFETLGDEQWWEVLDTKLMGYVRTLRAVLPVMAAQQYGRVVNITGRGGRQPTAAHLPGSCANAAVNLLTKGLADSYGARNIRVNAVAPGPIRSDRLDQLLQASATANDRDAPGQLRMASPIQRPGTPQDVADAVLYLISPRSDYITGIVLQVDGGGTVTL
jgi:NAD(P)-dependent dehydrogenase (short-subunit alcohol dehydrogenase family)